MSWILRVELSDERYPRISAKEGVERRPSHYHIDVIDPGDAAEIITELNERLGPVHSRVEEYTSEWRCKDCRAWRLSDADHP